MDRHQSSQCERLSAKRRRAVKFVHFGITSILAKPTVSAEHGLLSYLLSSTMKHTLNRRVSEERSYPFATIITSALSNNHY